MNSSTLQSRAVTQVVLPGIVEPAGLQLRHVTLRAPGPGALLIRMEATGVSFAEKAMRRGRYPGQPRFPFVPGYDAVGTVLAVGRGSDQDLVGKRVAAALKTGGWATEILVPAGEIVVVPDGIDATNAAAVIVNGKTAWQMLYRRAHVRPGQTILVLGASGGVGTILSQLALHDGIRVIGTASPRHHQALRELGVEPIDYAVPDLAASVRALSPRGVDAVFDHLGPASARRSFNLLDRGGALVSYGIAADLDKQTALIPIFLGLLVQLGIRNLLPNGKRASFYDFWQGGLISPARSKRRRREDLAKVFGLLATAAIKPIIAARFALHDAPAAMELAETRTTFGKVVIVP